MTLLNIVAKASTSLASLDLGTGQKAQAGSSLFGLIGPAIASMGSIAVASAMCAIGVAIIRHLIHPNDESAVATFHRIRRILMVISFLSMSGAVLTWVITGTTSENIPGLKYITDWFAGVNKNV